MTETTQTQNAEQELYGIATIDLNKKKVYVQWSFNKNEDWSKGEDIVLDWIEDTYYIAQTFHKAYIIDVDMTPNTITFYLKAKF